MKRLSGDYFGLLMIGAALLVIALIVGQILLHKQGSRDLLIKSEGRNLVRLLSSLPYEQLVPQNQPNSILDLISSKQIHSDFAYATVMDLAGRPLAVATSGQAVIPVVDLSHDNSLWTSEQELTAVDNGPTLLEFRAPVLKAGELIGHIRLGYFKPKLELAEIPFLGQLALPIFLLVPFIYFLINRELKPLKEANVQIHTIMQKQHIDQVSGSENEFQDFMQNFKRFVGEIDKRFSELDQQNFKIKASTLALTYQRQRTESALQSLPDGALVMDESGKAIFANAKLGPLIGVNMDEIIGKKPHEWCRNPLILDLLAKYHNPMQRFQRMDTLDIIPEHNPAVTVSVSTYPLFNPKDVDAIYGTLVVVRDKTHEVLANQAREEFINHVSHELKSPLNVIHMYAESLLEPDLPHEDIIAAINVINDETERLSNLINNLLNISKIEAGSIAINLNRVNFNEFIEDTFESVARSGNPLDLKFELDLPRNLSNIQVDKDLLRVALNNLLTNAVKYNTPNGKVILSAEESDNEILLNITDTGIGIPEKDVPHVFEKFYRADDVEATQRGGHGLGLALAKEIIELHHGNLTLHSQLGEGSVFSISLKKTSTFL